MSHRLVPLCAVLLLGLAACTGSDGMLAGGGAAEMQVGAVTAGRAGALPGEEGTKAQMSPSTVQLMRIAARDGDKDYIVVDKAAGEIVMVRNGVPVVRGSALTGASLADRLAPGALETPFSRTPRLQDKVTPAGRYTVAKAPDNTFGLTLNVNEIQGVDWDISIHRIFLGFPLERRGPRLASMNGHDKHITFGCIDVSAPIMQRLLARLPDEDETPVYIGPTDANRVAAYFPPRGPGAQIARADN